jgi:hypothetical protein
MNMLFVGSRFTKVIPTGGMTLIQVIRRRSTGAVGSLVAYGRLSSCDRRVTPARGAVQMVRNSAIHVTSTAIGIDDDLGLSGA